jgi:hypothetical protein
MEWIYKQKFQYKARRRQGGVLSTRMYKSYINDLPLELEKRGLCLTIGLEYYDSPLCADDLVLMSTDDAEIQTMLDIACKYSCQGDTKQSGLESIRVD